MTSIGIYEMIISLFWFIIKKYNYGKILSLGSNFVSLVLGSVGWYRMLLNMCKLVSRVQERSIHDREQILAMWIKMQ